MVIVIYNIYSNVGCSSYMQLALTISSKQRANGMTFLDHGEIMLFNPHCRCGQLCMFYTCILCYMLSYLTLYMSGMDLLGGCGGANPPNPGQVGCRGVLFS